MNMYKKGGIKIIPLFTYIMEKDKRSKKKRIKTVSRNSEI